MKCEICNTKIENNFLEKPIGTYIKDKKGKKHIICNNCQKNFDNNKLKILEKI